MERSSRSGMRAVLLPAARLVAIVIGVFMLLEVTARIHLFGLAGLLPEHVNSVHGLPQTGFTQPAPPDSGRIFDLKPGIDGYFKNVPFRTNSAGLRDREYALQKPENTFRVAVLGASFALPAGVAIEDAFHSRLEERFSAQFAPRRYEFINFSVGMYSPRQVLATLESRALAYEPDLILVTVTSLSMPWLVGNPPIPRRSDDEPRFRDHFQKSYPVLQSFFLRLMRQRMGLGPDTPQTYVGAIERLFMNAMQRLDPPAESPSPAKAAVPPTRAPSRARKRATILEHLAQIRTRTGIPVAIVRLEFDPSPRQPIDWEAEARARSLGIPYFDTREAFAGRKPSDFWIFEFDPHPDARAHGIFAQAVARFLTDSHLIPE